MVSRCAARAELYLCSQAQMTCRNGSSIQGAQEVEMACSQGRKAVSVSLVRAAAQEEPGLPVRPAESPH